MDGDLYRRQTILIILVFTSVAHASNVFVLQNLFKVIILYFLSFLVIIHTPPSENPSLQKLDANL
jgi:hypothetical protein